ncbi:tyrosine-protein phosphatase [Micromonospora sp. NPDC047074]|uniref:tyrosine-protein phosphatase n=1 Tax=Micromonospora sp. NPDC047074 TaxID=3154339 RepID=UPI00341149F2
MDADSPRTLLAGRVANLRDLGGLPAGDGAVVRQGRLLRSATLVHHDDAVLDEVTTTVGAGVYFDLRTDREVDRDGDARPLVARGWHWHRLPIQDLDPDDDVDEPAVRRYRRAMPRYLAAARTIGEHLGRYPVGVVACSLGKDRTGLVVAVLLRRLGVPLADIGVDFTLSNACLARQRRFLPPRWRDARRSIGQVVADDCLAALTDEVAAGPDPQLRQILLTSGDDGGERGVRLD